MFHCSGNITSSDILFCNPEVEQQVLYLSVAICVHAHGPGFLCKWTAAVGAVWNAKHVTSSAPEDLSLKIYPSNTECLQDSIQGFQVLSYFLLNMW